jgi:type I restriction enzyme S subunit
VQKRIAGILDQADELRRLRQKAIAKLNALGQSVFHEMFGDVVTNPLGWDSIKLGELCEVGSSKRVFAEEFMSDGVPFYRGTEVGRLGSGAITEPNLFISNDHYESLIKQSGKPALGDLLLPSICHDGRIWKVDHSDPFYFKDGRVLWIKSGNSKIDSEYLRGYLRNLFLKSYASVASGTTFAELKIVNLKNLEILYPPARLQEEYSSRIAEVESCRSRFMQSILAFTSLFSSLQQRAFNGEL